MFNNLSPAFKETLIALLTLVGILVVSIIFVILAASHKPLASNMKEHFEICTSIYTPAECGESLYEKYYKSF